MRLFNRYFLSRTKEQILIPGVPSPFRQSNSIFIHVPKCAGSTISIHLFGFRVGHVPISKYWAADKEFVQSAYKFAFVRHPYLRLWSAYRYLKVGGISAGDEKFRKEQAGVLRNFHTLVEAMESSGELLKMVHLRPQYSFLAIPPSKPYKVFMDFVGKTEFFGKDMEYIMKHLPVNMRERNSLIINNPLNMSPLGEMPLDDGLLKKVRMIYQEDYEVFGYEKWTSKSSLQDLLNNVSDNRAPK